MPHDISQYNRRNVVQYWCIWMSRHFALHNIRMHVSQHVPLHPPMRCKTVLATNRRHIKYVTRYIRGQPFKNQRFNGLVSTVNTVKYALQWGGGGGERDSQQPILTRYVLYFVCPRVVILNPILGTTPTTGSHIFFHAPVFKM